MAPLLSSVCVYCGSSNNGPQSHREVATELGSLMASRGIDLVYGGGRVGVMGTVADAVMSAGGKVTGIIPDFLMRKEVGHTNITSLEIVQNMHHRKARMAELSDAFLVLPGGLGTLEEFFEVLTWRFLGLHDKPIALLNTDRYWHKLSDALRNMAETGYAHQQALEFAPLVNTPEEALDLLAERASASTRFDTDNMEP